MTTLPNVIVYIWLIPLVLNIVFPLLMLVVYLLGSFIYFMFFPRRTRKNKPIAGIPEGELEKAV